MGKSKSILYLLFLLLTSQILSQQFDLLKDYEPGQSIIYQFYRSATPTNFFNDTVTTITVFSGTYRTYIDSVTVNPSDSTRFYNLNIHKVGIETIQNSIRIISTRNIDTLYSSSITEHLNSNYNSGSNRIEGWLFPDTVNQSPRCPYDTTIFNPYSYYYKYYNFPSADTFDVRGDSLILTNNVTDCLDYGYTSTYVATIDEGLINRINYRFNFFSWSYADVFTKSEVSSVKLSYNEPSNFYLSQNYPNPFNPSTKISWQSPVGNWQTLKIYDVLGNEVATLIDEYKSAGNYEAEFNASNLTSGIYFYQLKAGSFVGTKKMLLLK